MKYAPIGYTADGKAILHHEDFASAKEAVERGWTEDEALYGFIVAGGINYPDEKIKLVKISPQRTLRAGDNE